LERGRKLLLADDSVTIQKVVDLTFGDEDMQVETVGDGEQALEKLEEFMPDIVLADIFMPKMNGYEVCERIKTNERFRHIPVMLLVGSFEPFDEAEARRVGADDYLTKPFQSIRELINKVSALLGGKSDAQEATTRELPSPQADAPQHEASQLSPEAIEVTTADTARLPQQMVAEIEQDVDAEEEGARNVSRFDVDTVENFPSVSAALGEEAHEEVAADWEVASHAEPEGEVYAEHEAREFQQQEIATAGMNVEHTAGSYMRTNAADDALLDLDFGGHQAATALADDDILGLREFEPQQVSAPAEMPASTQAEFEDTMTEAAPHTEEFAGAQVVSEEQREEFAPVEEAMTFAPETAEASQAETWADTTRESEPATETGFAFTSHPAVERAESAPSAETLAQTTQAGQITLNQLSPEVIDAIARRAVEMLSAQVVEQVAWEVVPQLAELLIKRRLEEERSQPK